MRCLDPPYQDSRNMELGYKITKKNTVFYKITWLDGSKTIKKTFYGEPWPPPFYRGKRIIDSLRRSHGGVVLNAFGLVVWAGKTSNMEPEQNHFLSRENKSNHLVRKNLCRFKGWESGSAMPGTHWIRSWHTHAVHHQWLLTGFPTHETITLKFPYICQGQDARVKTWSSIPSNYRESAKRAYESP